MENKALFKTDPGGWIHIAPFGEHPHSCGVIQVVDRKGCDAMVSAFEARRDKEGEAFAGVLLDYDHFSMDTDKPSEAAGWIVELATRDDGLWGKVRWTDTGLKAVEGGRYRLVSAVFPRPEELEVVDAKLNKRRPLELRSCALTNEPNIKGGKPIANRLAPPSRGGAETGNRETAGIPGVPVGGEEAKRYMWLLGETKSGRHCSVCTGRHGQVKTLLEWMKMPAPYCRCACHLAEVGVDVNDGYKPPKPEDPKKLAGDVKNRVSCVGTLLLLREVRGLRNRWSDAARVASVAARLAKYGAMMGLKPWGDSARLAAAAARGKNAPGYVSGGAAGPAVTLKTGQVSRVSAPRKPRVKKTRKVDKFNDVCFRCGEKGHWAYECPEKADKGRMQEKIDAGVAKYKRLLELPVRPGGYHLDGTAAIPDMKGALAEWSRTSRADGTPVILDSEPYERLREAADKDFKAWLSRVQDAEGKIETFNALVAAVGGSVAAAAGAPDPTGGASWAFGAELGATAGKRPFSKSVEAYMRLGRKPVNPYEVLTGGHDAAKDPPGLDGLTRRERILVAVKFRDKAISMWFQSFNGTPAEGNTKPPNDPAEMFRQLPKVTGRPDIVKELVDMSKQDVLKSRARLRRTVDEDAAVRKKYIDDILKADPQARYSHDIRHIDTRFLRMWRDRVTGTGIYGKTGAMSPEVLSGRFEGYTGLGDSKHNKVPLPMSVMATGIRKYLPEVPLELLDKVPPTVVFKLYKRAMGRKKAGGARSVGFEAIDGDGYFVEDVNAEVLP